MYACQQQYGIIRFGGTTEFHPGQWAGIELDNAIGKNDGSYGGIRYFTCKAKYGLFVPMHRISKDTNVRQVEKKKKKKRDSSVMSSLTTEAQSHLRMNEIQVGGCGLAGRSMCGWDLGGWGEVGVVYGAEEWVRFGGWAGWM